jgi:cytoskeleton protein RodZ
MSEGDLQAIDLRAAAGSSTAPRSGGEMLRLARENLGLHIAALAVSLKVPVKKLEALEADQFDLLPDIVFVRALTASVCRTLKIDPAPVLEKMPQTSSPYLKAEESGINVPFRASAIGSGMLSRDKLTKPLVWLVVALLLGALGLFLLPLVQHSELLADAGMPGDAVTQPLPAAMPMATETEAPISIAPAVVPVASAPDVAASALAVAVTGSGATTGVVVFKARGASWVEVIDANSVVQLRRTMADGAIAGASGVLPLAVVVGRADAMEVQVRGQAFDLKPIAKDNVARFEVK